MSDWSSRWLPSTPQDQAFVGIRSIGTATVVPAPRRFRRDQGWHSYQFVFTIEGHGLGDIAGTALTARPNSLWILPPDRSHGYECDPRHPQWTYRWIEFNGDAAPDLIAMLGFDRQPVVHNLDAVHEQIERIHGQLLAEGEAAQHEATARLIRVLTAAERIRGLPSPAADSLVEGARRWMERHLGDCVRLEDLARALRLSPFTVAHRFRAATGVPPMAWLRQLRIAHAKALLHRGDLSIAAIGRAVGYPTAPHFTRAFVAETGMTPKAFRDDSVQAMRD